MSDAQQVILIHGGETFDNYEDYLDFLKNYEIDFERAGTDIKRWKDNLSEDLGSGFEVIAPSMPNKMNAKYVEWKIWFEKFIPFFKDGIILVGHSLGATFIAKYLSENDFEKRVIAVFLVAPAYDSENADYSMADFELRGDLKRLEWQVGQIFVYHSKDDEVVSFEELHKFRIALGNATFRIFEDRGHFVDQQNFPELAQDIQGVPKNK
jgi:uncharacterized protein